MTTVKVTQLAPEALVAAAPKVAVTQLVPEALMQAAPNVKITQLVVEALIPAGGPAARSWVAIII